MRKPARIVYIYIYTRAERADPPWHSTFRVPTPSPLPSRAHAREPYRMSGVTWTPSNKDDSLFKEESTAAIDAFNYGVSGEQALVHNYLGPIYRKNINVLEIYAYCFDKLLPYLKGVPKKETDQPKCILDSEKG